MAAEQQPDTEHEENRSMMIVAKKAAMSSTDILLNNNKVNVVEIFNYLGVTVTVVLTGNLTYHSCWLSKHKDTSEDLQTNNPPSDRFSGCIVGCP